MSGFLSVKRQRQEQLDSKDFKCLKARFERLIRVKKGVMNDGCTVEQTF